MTAIPSRRRWTTRRASLTPVGSTPSATITCRGWDDFDADAMSILDDRNRDGVID
ncbi:MAG: hypothetical protein QF464_12950 [Myxococcota bacterium]|nr:hypothetical protein [Myxococcota bacterium]